MGQTCCAKTISEETYEVGESVPLVLLYKAFALAYAKGIRALWHAT